MPLSKGWKFDEELLALVHVELSFCIPIDRFSAPDILMILADLARQKAICDADLGAAIRALDHLLDFPSLIDRRGGNDE